MRDPTITLIMPCHNEADRLDAPQLLAWFGAHPNWRLVCVDDGSTDRTPALLRDLAGSMPRQASVIALPTNRGKAEAVRCGAIEALKSPDAAIIGYMDADLATPFDEFPRLAAPLIEGPAVDITIGSRRRGQGRDIRMRPWRHIAGRCCAIGASAILHQHLYDTQCGAKLIRVADWTPTLFAEPFASRWVFDVELLARYQRCRVVRGLARTGGMLEVPLECWRDVGRSKVRPADYPQALIDLLRIARRYR